MPLIPKKGSTTIVVSLSLLPPFSFFFSLSMIYCHREIYFLMFSMKQRALKAIGNLLPDHLEEVKGTYLLTYTFGQIYLRPKCKSVEVLSI